jgi:hypothetical protein
MNKFKFYFFSKWIIIFNILIEVYPLLLYCEIPGQSLNFYYVDKMLNETKC